MILEYSFCITDISDMAASEPYSFTRTEKFSTMQAENFWQMRNDGTYTDFTILTKDKTFQVNIVCSTYQKVLIWVECSLV